MSSGGYDVPCHDLGYDVKLCFRLRKIKNFTEGDTHDYCLREIVGAKGRVSPLILPERPSGFMSPTTISTPTNDRPSIRVTLPSQSQSKINVSAMTTFKDVLDELFKTNQVNETRGSSKSYLWISL